MIFGLKTTIFLHDRNKTKLVHATLCVITTPTFLLSSQLSSASHGPELQAPQLDCSHSWNCCKLNIEYLIILRNTTAVQSSMHACHMSYVCKRYFVIGKTVEIIDISLYLENWFIHIPKKGTKMLDGFRTTFRQSLFFVFIQHRIWQVPSKFIVIKTEKRF